MDENIKAPAISVLMPVYNGEKYLREAIESILNQTFIDFELLLINDASTDNSEEIINSYNDSRIVYIKNEQNLGLIKTLNKGLDLVKGEFIARMDQDDISNLERFAKQIALFETNPEIGVCGTLFTLFRENHEDQIIEHPESNDSIKIGLLTSCFIGHPTVMIRKKAIKNYRYDINYQAAEDYELWTRLVKITQFYNIQESLLKYRFHTSNMSVLENNTQSENSKKITGNQLKYLDIANSKENIELCRILLITASKFRYTDDEFRKLISFANKLEYQNSQKKVYSEKKFHEIINKRLIEIFNKTVDKNFSTLPFVLKNRKEIILQRSILANTKMLAKMILKK
ncbi:glycosyltransferase [Chryseobacterium sp. Ch-15]|uniref:Glycosyltransferase n=1 Tax=Chryseobacterium muglaense TaxID=2893752 RepID=A0A9Q3YTJ7_9FLAO|nr:glycosyltransferase [Chryseobacterium muglaense]MBD3903823.1 glycosyltransferase [Chryseobacterium muglaense]MCC9034897.1 glycosyltransferase [Chryseobacterium muglaense]MCM2553162.1 glycosyltransferase [Chryseobacterium muglaense]